MKRPRRVLTFFNILSIDVACGAVISAWFFASLLGVPVRPAEFTCLGLTVWIIYTADHLYDAWRMKTLASTERHQFHQNHFNTLLVVLLLVALADLSLTPFITFRVFHWGIALAAGVFSYFLIQSRLGFLKEVVGALLYSAGVLLPSLPEVEEPPSSFTILLMTVFALTALLNLILFSWFDFVRDLQDRRSSLVTVLGNRASQLLLITMFSVQGFMTACLFWFSPGGGAVWVLAAMNFMLLFVFLESTYFSVHDRYRFVGDAIFFVPLFYLLG